MPELRASDEAAAGIALQTNGRAPNPGPCQSLQQGGRTKAPLLQLSYSLLFGSHNIIAARKCEGWGRVGDICDRQERGKARVLSGPGARAEFPAFFREQWAPPAVPEIAITCTFCSCLAHVMPRR